jgi:F-type H+-transporting ATPase subunit b
MRKLAFWITCAVALFLGSLSYGVTPTRPEPSAPTATTHAASATGEDAAGAHAAANPVDEELHRGTFAATILIFLCLVVVLGRTAWKPILMALQNRENTIRESIEAAKKAKEAADVTTKELEAKMAEVQRQAALQLQQARADAAKVADAMRAQAEAESAAIKDRTLREINSAKLQAVAEINSHAAELGTSIARKILQRNVTPDDQQRLVDESLAEMAKKN